jgi:hypothetical protein
MRVFLCAFGNFSLAIPITYISSIMLYYGNSDKKIEYNNENRNTYISLPVLFDYRVETPRHGIILKNGENDEDNGIIENKTILLTTEIECEMNIPEEKLYSIPKILDRIKFSRIFSGIIFGLGSKDMLLFLNPELLIQNLQKELI